MDRPEVGRTCISCRPIAGNICNQGRDGARSQGKEVRRRQRFQFARPPNGTSLNDSGASSLVPLAIWPSRRAPNRSSCSHQFDLFDCLSLGSCLPMEIKKLARRTAISAIGSHADRVRLTRRESELCPSDVCSPLRSESCPFARSRAGQTSRRCIRVVSCRVGDNSRRSAACRLSTEFASWAPYSEAERDSSRLRQN